ncbi:helix-turn-helix domain-containing protein [Bathymodiolus platifrons methanotrophic gill symbiont]|uniref:helix-turn-helix domain-containing protein n=1 Tax=Bathymodiolus platifrons methanotrophic gill symbiont TaxID=113268 RepID=UPI001E2C4961|nr:helix-turn-helix domain-containing protein [Bathymodiolus platifrons methanotrophic gill symbiont]
MARLTPVELRQDIGESKQLPNNLQRLQMSYTHLCPEERYYIEIELKKGTSQNKIAEALERSQSNISREIKRNTGQRGYRHKQAEDFAQERHKNKPKEVIN